MCGVGNYRFAFRKTSLLGSNVVFEQCDACGEYRKQVESDLKLVEE